MNLKNLKKNPNIKKIKIRMKKEAAKNPTAFVEKQKKLLQEDLFGKK